MAEDKTEIVRMIDAGEFIVAGAELDPNRMPPILAGHATKALERRVERFYFSIGKSSRPGSNVAPVLTPNALIAKMSKRSLRT